MLRGTAELFLNDLSEKTGSHDIVRLHRLIFADEPRVGDAIFAPVRRRKANSGGCCFAVFRRNLPEMSGLKRKRATVCGAGFPTTANGAKIMMASLPKARRSSYTSGFTAWESTISWKGCCGAVFRTLLSPPQPCTFRTVFRVAGDEWSEAERPFFAGKPNCYSPDAR